MPIKQVLGLTRTKPNKSKPFWALALTVSDTSDKTNGTLLLVFSRKYLCHDPAELFYKARHTTAHCLSQAGPIMKL